MKYLALLLLFTFAFSCQSLLTEELANTPQNNVLSLWEQFDLLYGQFPNKNIDWDSVRVAARSRAENINSQLELFDLLVEMMEPLNDSHIGLVPIGTNIPLWHGGRAGKIDSLLDFHLDVIKDNYLIDVNETGDYFTYGMLNERTGYLYIEGFSDLPKNNEDPLDEIIDFLNTQAENVIIDVRGGYGGEDVLGQYIAGRFASHRQPYMISKVRNGPSHEDYTEPITWYVEPQGKSQFIKPVVVLTHNYTLSARETFCLALKTLDEVTFIGDTTAGGFSNQINRELPNGWGFSLSIGDWRDADGISHEGIGLIPDVQVTNNKEMILNGKDQVLEMALAVLKE